MAKVIVQHVGLVGRWQDSVPKFQKEIFFKLTINVFST